MMSLINTNKNYLSTMGISEESPQVGVIVAVYYLGCSVGAVLFSWFADRYGRKPACELQMVMGEIGDVCGLTKRCRSVCVSGDCEFGEFDHVYCRFGV